MNSASIAAMTAGSVTDAAIVGLLGRRASLVNARDAWAVERMFYVDKRR